MCAANKNTTWARTRPYILQSESQHRLSVSPAVTDRDSKVFAESLQEKHLGRKQLCVQRVVLILVLVSQRQKLPDLILLTAFPLGQWVSRFALLNIREESLDLESYLYIDV